jgi:hypothetical protein
MAAKLACTGLRSSWSSRLCSSSRLPPDSFPDPDER